MTRRGALRLMALVLLVSLIPQPVGAEPAAAQPAGETDYLVRFAGPTGARHRQDLASTGAEVLSFQSGFVFKVRMTEPEVAAVAAVAGVVEVAELAPAAKLHPAAVGAAERLWRVVMEQGGDTAALSGVGGVRLLRTEGRLALVSADGAALERLALLLDVAWVEPFALNEKHNEFGAGVIIGGAAANASGYDGSTQIVAVADTGLGTGVAATAHPDIPAARITAIHDWPGIDEPGCWVVDPDGAQDVDSGHGTHVAGSVLSDGDASGRGTGTAPAASLVFQAVEDYADVTPDCGDTDGYGLYGIPLDITPLFQQAYDDGARVHSNSWGENVAGDYTANAATADEFIWNNPDLSITFSAGNSGTDDNFDGVVDDDSIGSPATAKNVITVGASENERTDGYPCDVNLTYLDSETFTSCADRAGFNDIFPWFDFGFFANPLADDPSAGNAEQMAAFSSRGPTDDGRIKPDVVAPGTWILSGYSDLFQEQYDAAPNPVNGAYQYDGFGAPLTDDYKYIMGTSMSNPIVAGAVAVVRDFYQKTEGHDASAALVKATLINSATDLLDENNDGVDDNDFPIPNFHEGWGRVDLVGATDGTGFWHEGDGLEIGLADLYSVDVAAGTPLRMSLVWSDYPSTESALTNLVNDLDLVLTAPNGSIYRGNVFSGGWTTTGGAADRINNVENVYIQAPAAGEWTLTVTGFNVPQGPQPYALVIDGSVTGFEAVVTPPTVALTAPAAGAEVSGTVTVTATTEGGATSVQFFVDGVSIGTDSSAAGGWSVSWPTTSGPNGDLVVEAIATGGGGLTASDEVAVVVNNLGPGGTFIDDDGNVHEAAIEAIAAVGVTKGCNPPTNNLYCPADQVTRGQMAAFLVRALDLPAATQDYFVDDNGSVFEADINALARSEVTKGCNPPTNDRFCPDDPVTRGQMAAFLVRALGLTDPGVGDLFVDDDASVFQSDIDKLATEGITKGCNPPTNDRFCPDDPVLRDQMGSFLQRALGLTPLVPG